VLARLNVHDTIRAPMQARTSCSVAILLLTAGIAAGGVQARLPHVTPAAGSDARELLPRATPGSSLPILREHRYRMAGKVRALLLWMGRDDVGSGIIRWRGSEQSRAYELLIGTDPSRAPGNLNKWGYLAEEVRAGECDVVGVISKDSEHRLSDVKAGLASGQSVRPFDTIRGRVTQRQAYARVGTLQASSSLTYREADALLKLTLADASVAMKQIDRPSGVRPGFLSSVAELIHTSLSVAPGKRLPVQRIPYVYGDELYELRLLDATPMARFERDGQVFESVIRGRFETGRLGHRSGTRFELVYGSSGKLAGIPILISYQPKWWLHVDLVLQI
jgi:hypothetical protein